MRLMPSISVTRSGTVTDTVEPVTDTLEPVTDTVDPVIEPVATPSNR